jgi:hypothetical protein
MLEAIEVTAGNTRNKIERIRGLMNDTIKTAKEKLPARIYSKELGAVISSALCESTAAPC